MKKNVIETGALVFSKEFASQAVDRGLGRYPTEEEIKAIEAAGGITDLPDDHILLIMIFNKAVSLGVLPEYMAAVTELRTVVVVSHQTKKRLIKVGWGYEPTARELEQHGEKIGTEGLYQLVALNSEIVS